MAADLLEKLKIVTELGVQSVGQKLHVLSVALILLSVQEPVGDLVLAGVLHDAHQLVDLWCYKKNQTPESRTSSSF